MTHLLRRHSLSIRMPQLAIGFVAFAILTWVTCDEILHGPPGPLRENRLAIVYVVSGTRSWSFHREKRDKLYISFSVFCLGIFETVGLHFFNVTGHGVPGFSDPY